MIDNHDPIIRAYQKAFPSLFTPGSKMPATLRAHLRYPENLFQLQSNVYSTYHVQNVSAFYSGTERWLLSPDPNAVLGATVTPTTTRGQQRAPEITRHDTAPGPLLPLHPPAGRHPRELPHPAALRAGVAEQRPDPPRVVHDREVGSERLRADPGVRHAPGRRPSTARCRSRTASRATRTWRSSSRC